MFSAAQSSDAKSLDGSMLCLRLDWNDLTMLLEEVSPDLRALFPQIAEAYPLMPFIQPLEHLSRQHGARGKDDGGAAPVRFLLDCNYDHDRLCCRLHISSDYDSVINVPQEQMQRALRGILTPRETDIAIRLFQGGTIRCIANCLHVAEGTVKRTIYNIYQKMQICSQVELIREIYVLLAQQAGGMENAEHKENAEE